MADYRIEIDSLGEIEVPADALYGPQTERAVQNFPISGIRLSRVFIRALGLVKAAAAEVNAGLGLLDSSMAEAIEAAAGEVASGRWDDHFPLDIFQTGSGTSTNMNANEVIANRAGQIVGDAGDSGTIHPNDHVNLGQSSNDVIPTAIHVAGYIQLSEILLPSLSRLYETVRERAGELEGVVKTGRTHLMDAMPVRMGHCLDGWAHQIRQGIERVESCQPKLARLAIGGTAVGTGINTHPEFGQRVAAALASVTGFPFIESEEHFSAQSGMDAATELSGHLKTTASALMKISNDLRWMNSGPGAGLAEITLPELQPGSSIMPGKFNPVICEAVMMVCAQVIGNDVTVTLANGRGNFELNTMLPLIAYNVIQSITILGNGAGLLADKAVAEFTVNTDHLKRLLQLNPFLAAALSPVVGYDKAAEITRRAREEGRSIKEVAAELTDIPADELDRILDPGRLSERSDSGS